MNWTCPIDQQTLTRTAAGLACPECSYRGVFVDGLPVFDDPPSPTEDPLAELCRGLEAGGAEESLEAFCAARGCTPGLSDAGWRFLFAAPPGTVVVEIGPGLGCDTPALGVPGGTTLALAPSVTSGRVARRGLARREGTADCRVAVVRSLDRIPLPAGSVGAIVMDGIEASGFDLGQAEVSQVARAWRRLLRPDGVVFVGMRNRLHGLPGVGRLRRRVGAGRPAEALNRCVRRSSGRTTRPAVGRLELTAAMSAAGFAEPRIYAPFPDEARAEVVLPVDDAPIVRYFLTQLVRQSSPAVRLAVAAGKLLADVGIFHAVFPSYHYLVFRPASARGRS